MFVLVVALLLHVDPLLCGLSPHSFLYTLPSDSRISFFISFLSTTLFFLISPHSFLSKMQELTPLPSKPHQRHYKLFHQQPLCNSQQPLASSLHTLVTVINFDPLAPLPSFTLVLHQDIPFASFRFFCIHSA